MARAREFDGDAVLDEAARLFWRMGYDAVTIEDLEAATGVGRGSLYNAFKDKEGVFLAALDRYVAVYAEAPFAHLDAADVATGIARMLEAIVARMSESRNPRGCLLTNTSLAAVATSGRIEARIAESMSEMERRLATAIARARRERQIPAGVDVTALARFYGSVAQGLGVHHKVFGDRAALDDVVAVALSAWPGRRRPRARARTKSRER